jgi:hypothetical protein
MAIGTADIYSRLLSHAKRSGLFDRVLGHEPKSKPARGLTYAVWLDRIEPARGQHGLKATSARVVMKGRIYTAMLQEPQDAIDPQVMIATDKMFESYSSNFSLGGELGENRFIDLLGITQGHTLDAESGYINIDNMVFRVMTITIPVVVYDAWPQVR